MLLRVRIRDAFIRMVDYNNPFDFLLPFTMHMQKSMIRPWEVWTRLTYFSIACWYFLRVSNPDIWNKVFNWFSLHFFYFSEHNECLNNPCENGGTCFNTPGSYYCSCKTGWTGSNCTQGIYHPLWLVKSIWIIKIDFGKCWQILE